MESAAIRRSPTLTHLLLAAASVAMCTPALADGLARAKQRGKLSAGIHYVVPEHKGGMKFRTPETLDHALLEDVARRMNLPLLTQRVTSGKHVQALASGSVDTVLATLADKEQASASHTVIPTGYSSGPMAIMRTDTDIKSWEQLKGRKVCVSEGGMHVGTMAAKYGATELVYKAPADALIAVRTGECDATVHDSAMLEELIKYPEWKKFSARLPAGPKSRLAFVLPAADRKSADFIRQVTADWAKNGTIDKTMSNAVRNIAFEVYLDQNVPDCH